VAARGARAVRVVFLTLFVRTNHATLRIELHGMATCVFGEHRIADLHRNACSETIAKDAMRVVSGRVVDFAALCIEISAFHCAHSLRS
jgi:hypothetical protein